MSDSKHSESTERSSSSSGLVEVMSHGVGTLAFVATLALLGCQRGDHGEAGDEWDAENGVHDEAGRDGTDLGDGAEADGDGEGSGECVPPNARIVLEDGAEGLRVVEAPAALVLDVGVGHFVLVETRGFHRPIDVEAELPIHTFVNDTTSPAPDAEGPFGVGVLDTGSGILRVQTLRMYDHELTLHFRPREGSEPGVSIALSAGVRVPRDVVLFGADSSWIRDVPFHDVYGPDCTPCGNPTTTSRDCYRLLLDQDEANVSRCRPWGAAFDPALEAGAIADAVQRQVLASQVVRDGATDQSHVFVDADLFAWQLPDADATYPWIADWVYRQLKPSVGGHRSGGWSLLPGATWMAFCGDECANACHEDVHGIFDPSNEFLMRQFESYVGELASRYRGQIPFYELVNEPAAEFWLCGCTRDGRFDEAVCRDNPLPCGPDLPICWRTWDSLRQEWLGGPYDEDFVGEYGDLMFSVLDRAATAIESNDPDARIVAPETDTPGPETQMLSAITRDFIRRGFFRDHPNAVLGIHSYPGLDVRRWLGPMNCSYAGAFEYALEEGCETAPPLSGTFRMHPDDPERPVRDLWADQDRATDLSELLDEIRSVSEEAPGTPYLDFDALRLWNTEYHSGFNMTYGETLSDRTSPAREAIAGLRIAAISAHQGFIGIEFVMAPLAEPDDFNRMVRYLSGARPVWRPDAPRIDLSLDAYEGLVAKPFTRGSEDILIVWNNASDVASVMLEGIDPDACYRAVKHEVLSVRPGAGGEPDRLVPSTTVLAAPPTDLEVRSLVEIHILTVVSDRPGFGWLGEIAAVRSRTP